MPENIIAQQIEKVSIAAGRRAFSENEQEMFGLDVEKPCKPMVGRYPAMEEFLRKEFDLTTWSYRMRGSRDAYVMIYSLTPFALSLRWNEEARKGVAEKIKNRIGCYIVVLHTPSHQSIHTYNFRKL